MRHAWRMMSAVALVLAAASILVSAWLFKLNADRSDDIQASRLEAIQSSCVETNRRHDHVIAELDALINNMPPGPRKERAEANRDNTVALLEALTPHRQCDIYARSLTRKD